MTFRIITDTWPTNDEAERQAVDFLMHDLPGPSKAVAMLDLGRCRSCGRRHLLLDQICPTCMKGEMQ